MSRATYFFFLADDFSSDEDDDVDEENNIKSPRCKALYHYSAKLNDELCLEPGMSKALCILVLLIILLEAGYYRKTKIHCQVDHNLLLSILLTF